MDGELGTYIALTSERLTGFAVYQARLATHFIPSPQVSTLLEKLVALEIPNNSQSQDIYKTVNQCIEDFAAEDNNTKSSLVGAKRKAIDECFGHDRMEDIVKSLQRYAHSNGILSKWAEETIKTIESKSPTSLKVTLEGIRRGGKMGINEVLQMDMEIGEMFCVSRWLRFFFG